jgi:4-hydroxy-tetrahydrodipicolinate synthase
VKGLHGTWFVVPTPFHDDGSLDLESLHRLVEAAIGWGVDGLTAMGVTSEASALTTPERTEALQAVSDAAGGRVPLVVGCSAGSVEAVAALANEARPLGAEAVMVSAPPLAPAVDGLPAFFTRVGKLGELPVVIQDEPAATGVTIPVSTLLRCVEQSGSRTVKLEDPPTATKIAALLSAHPSLDVFGGLGGAFALYELRAGACGTMTGFAFPEILRAVREATETGDHDRAGRVFDRYLPLIQFEAQPRLGLAIRKELLRRRGVIRTATTRATAALAPSVASDLSDVLDRLGVMPGPGRFDLSRTTLDR